jgi:hypothetical protein
MIGEYPIDLFGHLAVAAPQPCLDMDGDDVGFCTGEDGPQG